ncbi:MAG: histidine phosphatase family protein [Candidatus Lokiarchaeota archaeon]|nr:histidine phosphatase family protein [Candidatus Lokiarchaeota archaeon]
MPNNILILVRHAETNVDEHTKISKWLLTEKGQKDAINLFNLDLFDDVDIIITSDEEKANQTAYPLSKRLHKEIIREKDLNEILRDQGRYLKTKAEYFNTMKLCMENRNQSYNNWEPANKALNRFSKKIQEIDSKYSNMKILIVAHGGVINLYFAEIIGQLDKVFERIFTNTFCDYGIIQNKNVIKDIAKIDII